MIGDALREVGGYLVMIAAVGLAVYVALRVFERGDRRRRRTIR